MSTKDILRSAKYVWCQLCKVGFRGKELDTHDSDPDHVRRAQSHKIDLAVAKVDRFAGCNGRVFGR